MIQTKQFWHVPSSRTNEKSIVTTQLQALLRCIENDGIQADIISEKLRKSECTGNMVIGEEEREVIKISPKVFGILVVFIYSAQFDFANLPGHLVSHHRSN
jgi:hypothetical protein